MIINRKIVVWALEIDKGEECTYLVFPDTVWWLNPELPHRVQGHVEGSMMQRFRGVQQFIQFFVIHHHKQAPI